MYLQMSSNILRDHHEVGEVALYEVDQVLLLLVGDDDLLPLLFLQSETGQGVFLQELHPDNFVKKSLRLRDVSYLGSLANSVMLSIMFYCIIYSLKPCSLCFTNQLCLLVCPS